MSQEKFWRPSGLQANPLVSLAIRPLRSLAGVQLRVEPVSGLHSTSHLGSLQLPQVLLLEPGRDIKQRISSTSHFQHLSVTSSQVRFVVLYEVWLCCCVFVSNIRHKDFRGALHPLRSSGKRSTKVNRASGPARSFSIVNPRGRQLKALCRQL